LSPWSNPLSNYSESSTENGCCVNPEALLINGINDAQSSNGGSPIPFTDDDMVTRINSEETSGYARSDSTSRSVLDIEYLSRISPVKSNPPQPEDIGTPDTEGSNISSTNQSPLPQARDLEMLANTQQSSSSDKALSIRSLQRRLAGKAGVDTINHIHSVLRFSSSNSWRSSITSFASSWKSRGSSLLHRLSAMDDAELSTGPKLSACEQTSWSELVDETKLAPPAQSRLVPQEISLNGRPCCGTIDDFDQGDSCSTCGFSSAHNNGRHFVEIINQGLGTYMFSNLIASIDRFGNTPLHFAAASSCITTTALKSIITSGVNLNARNTSGENFMHVLNVAGLGGMAEYLDLLRFLQDTEFRFSDRDIHGRTVAHRLFDEHKPWEISIVNLAEIFGLLRVDASAVDNLGNDYGFSEIISSWRAALLEKPSNSLRLLIHQYCNPEYQNVDYRATLLSLLNRTIHHGLLGIELIGLEDWLGMITGKLLCKWVDIHGDTPLITLVRYYPEFGSEERFRIRIGCLVADGCDVNARDRHGYTALAIATRRGLRPIVLCLLNHGASVNTRSYHGTSTMSLAARSLHRAQKLGKEKLYGMIISCISLITDNGAKTEPSVYDEFGVF
jgi:hypothetical protein